jgi:serine protease Do
MSGQSSARRAAVFFVGVFAATYLSSSSVRAVARPHAAHRSAAAAASADSCGTQPVALPNFTGIVAKYGAAVVKLKVVEHTQSEQGPDGADQPFNRFFRRFGIPAPDQAPQNLPPERGTGSGFIVSSDGYILTNAHVVEDADQVTVELIDRREFVAKVVGIDDRTDIAVIKVDARGLPVVKFGDSSKLEVGQWVLAIGSPFNFENSVTAGIVSALGRTLPSDSYVPFIQTDVPVNPGNSGGPLFNVKGEVVGINSQIFSQTGGFMGLSFAIPIDVALNVETQLVRTGHVVRGRIGVVIQPVNAELADSFGLDRPRGALVASVPNGGPAAKAGIRPGDVILAVNGAQIERDGEVSSRISNMRPGSQARLMIWRGRHPIEVTVRIAELDQKPQRTAAQKAPGHRADHATRLGLSVRALTPQEQHEAQTRGSLIVEQSIGPAASAGVLPGDIILGVDDEPVHSVAELRSAADKAGKTLALLIQRDGEQQYFPLRLP